MVLLVLMQTSKVDLSNKFLRWVDLSGADLSGANLSGADLTEGVNLSDANLSGTNLSGVDLNGADLSGANLQGANLEGAQLQSAFLQDALYDSTTRFPEGFDVGQSEATSLVSKSSEASTSQITYDANVLSVDDARIAISTLDNAIDQINQERSYLGSVQNKLQFTMSNLISQTQSIEAARSSIQDTDFAADAA